MTGLGAAWITVNKSIICKVTVWGKEMKKSPVLTVYAASAPKDSSTLVTVLTLNINLLIVSIHQAGMRGSMLHLHLKTVQP